MEIGKNLNLQRFTIGMLYRAKTAENREVRIAADPQ